MQNSVLITGASTGIGKITALLMAQKGYCVFAGVRNEVDSKTLDELHQSITPIILDVTKNDNIALAYELISKMVGDDGLYALINNAGVTVLGPIELTSISDIKKTLDINFFGSINVIKNFIPLLRIKGGRIINISSTSAMNPVPYAGIYAASKCALEGASDSLRLELAHMGIKVSSLRPGNIKTPIWGKVKKNMEDGLSNMDEFQSEIYKKDINSLMDMLEKNNSKSLAPEIVGEKICNILKQKNPKAYYLVGRSAWIQYFAKILIPTKIFDGLKRKVFFKHPKKKKDWSGEKYKIAEDMGERIDMVFARFDDSNGEVSWFKRSHAKSDGISALVDLMGRDQITVDTLPVMKGREKPSLFKRVMLLFKYLKESKLIDYDWKNFNANEKGDTEAFSYTIFTKEETSKIVSYCKKNGFSVTSYLLHCLNNVVRELFLNDFDEGVWLLPVNFRSTKSSSSSGANHTSSLSIRVKKEYNVNQLHGYIHGLLKDGVQWGAWIYSNFPKHLGIRAMKFIYKHFYNSHYLGLFSNIGNWPPKETSNNKDHLLFFGGAPGTSLSLINTVCISWNGRLIVNLQINPKVSKEFEDTSILMNRWVERVHKDCDLDSTRDDLFKRVYIIKTKDMINEAMRF